MKLKQLMLPGMMLLTSFMPSAAVDGAEELYDRFETQKQAYEAAKTRNLQTVADLRELRLELAAARQVETNVRMWELIEKTGTLTARLEAQHAEVERLRAIAEATGLQVIALHESREAKNQ